MIVLTGAGGASPFNLYAEEKIRVVYCCARGGACARNNNL